MLCLEGRESFIFVCYHYPIYFRLEDEESNFSPMFNRFFVAQAKETARQCIEPPLLNRKKVGNVPPFKPSPSLLPVLQFLIKSVKTIPDELCQLCNNSCLPENPQVIFCAGIYFVFLYTKNNYGMTKA